jgi:hypothetical protein
MGPADPFEGGEDGVLALPQHLADNLDILDADDLMPDTLTAAALGGLALVAWRTHKYLKRKRRLMEPSFTPEPETERQAHTLGGKAEAEEILTFARDQVAQHYGLDPSAVTLVASRWVGEKSAWGFHFTCSDRVFVVWIQTFGRYLLVNSISEKDK